MILEKKAYDQLSHGFMVCFNDTCKLLSAEEEGVQRGSKEKSWIKEEYISHTWQVFTLQVNHNKLITTSWTSKVNIAAHTSLFTAILEEKESFSTKAREIILCQIFNPLLQL